MAGEDSLRQMRSALEFVQNVDPPFLFLETKGRPWLRFETKGRRTPHRASGAATNERTPHRASGAATSLRNEFPKRESFAEPRAMVLATRSLQ